MSEPTLHDPAALTWRTGLDDLIAPLPGPLPCGESLRYEPVYAAIRAAREADDPTLPMGDWERPLKRADWAAVERLCVDTLRHRSKDLQVAAWLLEAATIRHQLPGLVGAVELLCGLIERHWPDLHPPLDGRDAEARLAPLVWLAQTLPRTLRLELVLLAVPGRRPPRLTLDDWERLRRPADDARPPPDPETALPARETVLELALGSATQRSLHALRDDVDRAGAAWARLSRLLDARVGAAGPALGGVAEVLARIRHTVDTWIAPRTATPPASDPSALRRPPGDAAEPPPQTVPPLPSAVSLLPEAAAVSIASREAAYHLLRQVADYLQSVEPHSPVPLLVRRAVRWGALPLPELMQELVREEGDLNRLFPLLRVPNPPA